jgi:hypothetical protein
MLSLYLVLSTPLFVIADMEEIFCIYRLPRQLGHIVSRINVDYGFSISKSFGSSIACLILDATTPN